MDEKGQYFEKMIVELRCDELRGFLKTSHAALEAEGIKFEERLDERLKGMEPVDRDQYSAFMEDDAILLFDKYPFHLTSSCFLMAYFFVEDNMLRVADNEADRREEPKPSEKAKAGVATALAFLRKRCRYTIPKTAETKTVERLRELRNCIAHDGSRIARGEKAFRTWVQSLDPKLTTNHQGEVRLSRDFCYEAIDTIKTFLEQVIDGMKDDSDKVKGN